MKRSHVLVLLAVAIALFFISRGVEQVDHQVNGGSQMLLADISPGAVARVVIESKDNSAALELKNDRWTVVERNNYAADANKVRSLMLKVFDLSSSQVIPGNASSHAKLGVAEESLQDGYSRIQLQAASGETVARLFFGKSREGSGPTTTSGQYVRRDGSDKVILVSIPLEIDATAKGWLDTQIVNVRESEVFRVEQYRLGEDTRELLYAFERGLQQNGMWTPLSLVEPKDTSVALEESVLTQVRGGLENLRFTDVQQASEGGYDFETVFKLVTGLVYTIRTNKSGEVSLAAVEVSQPADLVQHLTELNTESRARQEKESQAAQTESASPGDEASQDADAEVVSETSAEDGAEESERKVADIVQIADSQQVETLQKRFTPWVFELPEFQSRKFRFLFEDLVRKEVSEELQP